MATDARLSVGLSQHPKTRKLIKRLGQAAGWNLVCLILWTAANRSDGDLKGMSPEDIELAADWSGEDGLFVRALTDVRFLDEEGGQYRMHDWAEHNPWAAGAEQRSAKARWNAAKRHHGVAEADRLVPEYAAVRNAGSNATSTTPAQEEQERSNAPSPSPSPSPIPTSPSLRSGEGAPDDARPPAERKSKARTLATYLSECKRAKAKPVPDDHHIRRWAADAGVTAEMLQIAWVKFRERYTDGEKGQRKRYVDWPGHFATAVKDNWFKLWFADDGGVKWTTNGLTCKTVLDAQMKQQEAAHAA